MFWYNMYTLHYFDPIIKNNPEKCGVGTLHFVPHFTTEGMHMSAWR